MKELLKTNRISLSKSYYYWRMYYLAPAFLAFGGTYGIIAGLYRGKSFDQLYVVIVFALLGWALLYWLDRQLHFKTYHVEGSIENLRDKLYSTMEADGWEFKN